MNIKTQGIAYLMIAFLGSIIWVSCDDVVLPDTGSITDGTPPEAGFSYSAQSGDDLTINFGNLSASATKFSWDFGDGNTSTDKEPSNTYAAYGTYNVTLVSSDNLDVSSTITQEVVVAAGPFQPVVAEPSFEDLQLAGGTGDGRDSWRNSDLGGVIQITSSPVRSGTQAAKLTGSAGDQRIGYQLVTVEADADYDLNFYYTMNDDQPGFITVSVLSGPVTSHAEAVAATIGSITVNDQSDPDTYEAGKVSFNSGTSTQVAIYFFNNGSVESRLDDFAMDIGIPGAVPPSPAFSLEQSATNFLEYSFTNSSINATSYIWAFGDGDSSTVESPTHVYTVHDVYTVSLTAINDAGKSATFSTMIDIQDPVTADFTFATDAANYQIYNFTDASVNAASLLWDFGDGDLTTNQNPTHTYADGTYTVKLLATSSTGLTSEKTMDVTVALGFAVQVLNGTFDEYTVNTGDNADAWDMTPNSTVVDNNGNTIDSPYRALWYNSDLNAANDALYSGTSEQPGSTSDGNTGRGGKFSNPERRLYQLVAVEQGATYTFSIDTRSEAAGINTEVFILNTEIADESGINASTSDAAIDAYFDITNDFNTDKSMFTKSTFTFTASSNKIVIYVRAIKAVDSSNEVFLDNVTVE